MHYSQITAASEAPAAEARAIDYYAGAKRVTVGGVPQRVFQWRSKELAAQISAIETARDAGCELDLADAPLFSFIPAEGEREAVKRRGALPVPKPSPIMREYYKGGERVIIGGVPCRVPRPFGVNHSPRHWASLNVPMRDWNIRAAQWWKGVQEARGEGAATAPIPVQSAPTGEIGKLNLPATVDFAGLAIHCQTFRDGFAAAHCARDWPLVREWAAWMRAVYSACDGYDAAALHSDVAFMARRALGVDSGKALERHAIKSRHRHGMRGRHGFAGHVHIEAVMRDRLTQLHSLPGFDPGEAREFVPVMAMQRRKPGLVRRKVRRADLFDLVSGWIKPVNGKGEPMARSNMPFDWIKEILPDRNAGKAAESPVQREADPTPPATLAEAPATAAGEAPAAISGHFEPMPTVEPSNTLEIAHGEPQAAETSHIEGADGPLAAILARLEALEASIAAAPLPVESIATPTSGKPKRSPAHERAVRRAWQLRWQHRVQRKAADSFAREAQSWKDVAEAADESDRLGREAMRNAHERISELETLGRMLATKRRRNALLARQRTGEMVVAVNAMHDQADGLRQRNAVVEAELEQLRADMADPSQPERASDIAQLVKERDEARTANAALQDRCRRVEASRDELADKFEGLISRVSVAEAAVRRLAQAA